MSRVGVVFGGLAISATLSAAVLHSVNIEHERGRYELVSDSYLDAPREAIFDVLTDYDRFDRISGSYKEFGFMEPTPDGTPVVYTIMEGCVLFFCKSLRRVELLETKEPGFIRTVTLPEQSDFRYAVSQWILEPEADGTRMTYRLEFEPDFWVPPLIGPWALKQRLVNGGGRAVNRIERLARGDSPAGRGN